MLNAKIISYVFLSAASCTANSTGNKYSVKRFEPDAKSYPCCQFKEAKQSHNALYNRVQRSSLPTHAPSLNDMRGQNELLMVSLRCLMENVFLRLTSPSLLVILLSNKHTCMRSNNNDTLLVMMTLSMVVK